MFTVASNVKHNLSLQGIEKQWSAAGKAALRSRVSVRSHSEQVPCQSPRGGEVSSRRRKRCRDGSDVLTAASYARNVAPRRHLHASPRSGRHTTIRPQAKCVTSPHSPRATVVPKNVQCRAHVTAGAGAAAGAAVPTQVGSPQTDVGSTREHVGSCRDPRVQAPLVTVGASRPSHTKSILRKVGRNGNARGTASSKACSTPGGNTLSPRVSAITPRVTFSPEAKVHDGPKPINALFDSAVTSFFENRMQACHSLLRKATDAQLDALDDKCSDLSARICASPSGTTAVLPHGGGSASRLSVIHLTALSVLQMLIQEVAESRMPSVLGGSPVPPVSMAAVFDATASPEAVFGDIEVDIDFEMLERASSSSSADWLDLAL